MVSAQQLADYERRLSAFSPDDADAFRDLLRVGMELFELRSVDLCEQFDVTKPSVRNWRDGHTAPHPAVRELVVGYLAECAAAQKAQAPLRTLASASG